MTFNVFERLTLLNVLPESGNITALRILRKLKEDLSFSEDEHARLKLREDETGVHWEIAAEGDPKDIEIGPKAQELIANALKAVAENPNLTLRFLALYERFNPTE